MARILRKLDQKSYWYSQEWLKEGDVQSLAASRCLATQQNSLSIFIVQGDEQQVDRVVAALALTRQYLGHVDVAIVSEQVLEDCNITRTTKVEATTPDSEVNSWHADLVQLSVTNVSDLAKAIKSHGEISRFFKADVKRAIKTSLTNQWVNTDRIEDKLRVSLKKKGLASLL